MEIREMRQKLGCTQIDFSKRYHIPFRTIQNWELGNRKPPEYIIDLLERQIDEDLINRKTIILPKYDPRKKDLPKTSDYLDVFRWLQAVRKCIDEPIVFALDEAFMCQGRFLGRSDEFLIWAYGSDALTRFNGVVVLGNQISPYDVEKRDGIEYTTFNRTLFDALANEDILDMQGTMEAVSEYYSTNGDSFKGLCVPPKYQERFNELVKDIQEYYES